MPRYSKPYRTRAFWIRVSIVPALAVVAIAVFFYEELLFRHEQQTTWKSSPTIAEDTRIRPMARFALEYGSKGLYEVDVLAAYSIDGVAHQDWAPVSGAPMPQAQAQAEATRMKGKPCTLRWNPSAPDQRTVDAD